MKQLILPKNYKGETIFTLSEDDSHYLLRVQRKKIGYSLNILDHNGNYFRGTIIDITEGFCKLNLKKKEEKSSKNRELILFQSIPKGKKIDLMIRQSVEVGVSSIVPIMAEHSIPQFKTHEERSKKRDRWAKIIKEASQQSGTDKITILEPLQNLQDAIDSLPESYTGIFFHQVPLKNRPLHELLSRSKNKIVLVIGPEGGLSTNEVELLEKNNFTPVLLGKNILRAETATIFALGAVQMIINEREYWIDKQNML